jgi:hypothetical protein
LKCIAIIENKNSISQADLPVPDGPNKSPKAFWLLSTTGSNINGSPPRLNLTTPAVPVPVLLP